jgi:phospholipid/cholesterol/gamma-HCH transport system substrate-binding protein
MYASRATQFLVGLFALLGMAALAFLSFRLGRIELFATPSYVIFANFDNISGLKVGDSVQIAGVQVGKVAAEQLDDSRARVAMRINDGVKIDNDAIASIKTSGIIGDKYIAVSPGPGEKYLANGSTLRQTESAFVLEDAIGQLINNAGTGSGGKGKDEDSGNGGDSKSKEK